MAIVVVVAVAVAVVVAVVVAAAFPQASCVIGGKTCWSQKFEQATPSKGAGSGVLAHFGDVAARVKLLWWGAFDKIQKPQSEQRAPTFRLWKPKMKDKVQRPTAPASNKRSFKIAVQTIAANEQLMQKERLPKNLPPSATLKTNSFTNTQIFTFVQLLRKHQQQHLPFLRAL